MAQETGDLGQSIGKLLSDPEALQKAMRIAMQLKASGAFPGILQTDPGENAAANAAQPEKEDPTGGNGRHETTVRAQNPPGAPPEEAYADAPNAYSRTESGASGNAAPRLQSAQASQQARRNELLSALRPYLSAQRKERLDAVLQALRLAELAKGLGISAALRK